MFFLKDSLRIAHRLSKKKHKEALETFYGELEQLEVAFTPQRWNAIVEKVVVGMDGAMTFHFVNGERWTCQEKCSGSFWSPRFPPAFVLRKLK